MLRPAFVAVTVVAAVSIGSLASGCGNAFVVTDSFTAPPKNGGDAPDSLHDYVVGTAVTLSVRASRAFIDTTQVKVVSKNPDLVSVDTQAEKNGVITVKLHALKEGTAAIDFLDEQQRPIEERVIQVKLPDTIALAADIDANRGYTIPNVDPEGLVVAAGGSVTFRVTYTRAGSELKGVGVLVGDTTLFTARNPTKTAPDREFVTFIAPPGSTDAGDVKLKVADHDITTLKARVASLDEIAAIQLDEGPAPEFPTDGTVFVVWAKAFTKQATPVFGAPFAWSFDSSALGPTTGDDGDFLSYTRQGGSRRLIQATSGNATQTLTVEARAGTAQVGDEQAPASCASTSASSSAVAALALVALQRKRRRS